MARLLVDAGILTIAAFISPYAEDRLAIRKLFNDGEFIEVYLKCDLYEPPDKPEIILETDKLSIENSGKRILSYLKKRGYLYFRLVYE